MTRRAPLAIPANWNHAVAAQSVVGVARIAGTRTRERLDGGANFLVGRQIIARDALNIGFVHGLRELFVLQRELVIGDHFVKAQAARLSGDALALFQILAAQKVESARGFGIGWPVGRQAFDLVFDNGRNCRVAVLHADQSHDNQTRIALRQIIYIVGIDQRFERAVRPIAQQKAAQVGVQTFAPQRQKRVGRHHVARLVDAGRAPRQRQRVGRNRRLFADPAIFGQRAGFGRDLRGGRFGGRRESAPDSRHNVGGFHVANDDDADVLADILAIIKRARLGRIERAQVSSEPISAWPYG